MRCGLVNTFKIPSLNREGGDMEKETEIRNEFCKVKKSYVRLEVSVIKQGSLKQPIKIFYHKCFSEDKNCYDESKNRLKGCILEEQGK